MTGAHALDEAKAGVLRRAVEVAESAHAAEGLNRRALETFLHRYYRHVAAEDVAEREPGDVYGAAMSHYRFAATRPRQGALVRVYTPRVEEHGWTSAHTVVEVVTDDMPFLVASVTAELSRQARAIHLVVHPQLVVRRDAGGRLERIGDTSDPAKVPHDALVESWMHIEIDRETQSEDLERLEAGLHRVLTDVRHAVEDWGPMRDAALRIAGEFAARPPARLTDDLSDDEVSEGRELLRWLADGHFTFLGYREYDLATEGGEDVLRVVPDSGLGLLRSDRPASVSFGKLTPEARARAREPRLLVITKANSRSTVHRPSYLDYIGVKRFDEQGRVVGERRFLGLLSTAAYTEGVTKVPVVRRKVSDVVARSGFPPTSHSGKALVEILETYPRDELFQVPVDELLPIALSVLHLQERRRFRLFLRKDEYGRFFSALVYLPRDRYTTAVRLLLQDLLLDELGGASVDYTARSSESVLTRLHFIVRVPRGESLPDVDEEHIERRLAEATRAWADDFADALVDQCGEERAAALHKRYLSAFPEAYKEDFPARTAVADLERLEALPPEGGFSMNLYEPEGAAPGERRFKLYRCGPAVSLSGVLPVLQHMGVEVVDERPYGIERAGGPPAWVYDFGLRYEGELAGTENEIKGLFQDAFAAAWSGEAESDGFNALVLRAGITWRQAVVLRAYAKYLRQGGTTFSQDYIEQAVTTHPRLARLLVCLFEARFGPGRQDAGSEMTDGLVEELEGSLDQIASLDEDRILRSFLTLVRATLRTNYFQRDAEGRAKPYVSVKLDPRAIPDLPEPRPRYEIWVYSPRFEGVHLRFGPVARGGIRWSDRREDFRTEILGLVKAQMVKNAVIVPVGAKGGFVVKRPPEQRDAQLAEGTACYQMFIRGMLDITDNLVSDGGPPALVPPGDVVRHDGDDTYLVVAADKGTARFSDLANRIAIDYGYWLGDAFASGGSAGYDHKAMGITARGAWESVKRHFRELGHDTQRTDFTVVGIGDMSGDVFGNGMLLSRHIRLVAAFDHRHVFIDPDPDAERSYSERRRLYGLARCTWGDYGTGAVSEGGGVYPRTAKSIPLTPQARRALGIDQDVTAMTPSEVIRAILRAPVDLLWNGGIGTYVKAETESHADVGDKTNDAVRIDAAQLRARVVGEGGNLGFTQPGRIEYALAGGRINTDAIDNSAGVDTSDHEVNIKILLNRAVSNGDLPVEQRNELLAGMTDEVAELVLRDNYAQNVALASAVAQAPALLNVHARYLRRLERDGHLDRGLECLPRERQINERRQAGLGLTQPEFAVLLAYTKITLAAELIDSDLPDDPVLRSELYEYFPTPLRERFREDVDVHPLRAEITTTCLVNRLVDTAGTTFVFRLGEETGAAVPDIVRAHTAARVIYDLDAHWRRVGALDNVVDPEVQTRMWLEGRRLTERAARWFLNHRKPPFDIEAEISFFREGVADVVSHLPKLLRGDGLAYLERTQEELADRGVPHELATAVSGMLAAYPALDIVEVARDSGRGVIEVAEVYFDLAARLQLTQLLRRIIALPRVDRWTSLARASLRDDLYDAHAGLTFDVLATAGPDAAPEERFARWQARNAAAAARAQQTIDDILAGDSVDLAGLSVAVRVIRTMLRSSSLA
ncbi:MAG: NAD-glutamate dehydrogenase [Streptomycetales bacterium]